MGTTSYTYDDLNRLHTVTEPSTKVTTYTFDAAGNRATQTVSMGADSEVTTYTCNEQNRLTGAEVKLNNVITKSVVYTYDNNGNQTLITTTPYVNGIPQTPEITVCTYDELNQLTTTEMPNGDIINNTYAGDGFRVAKQVNGTTTNYVYIGDKVVLELDGAGNQIAKNVQGTTIISRTVGGTTLYYMFNGHADVTALIDAADAVQATYYYDAFGNIITSTGSANNPYTYAGYQYDEETGYYYLQSRFYDPITARFLSEDTYRGDPNDPLSLNLYTYCHNEPLMYSDPNGHWSLWGAISSAASNISSAAKAVTSAITSSSVYKAASSVVSSAVQKVKSTATYQKAAAAVAPVKAKAVVVAKNAVTQVKEAAKQISAPPTPKVTKTASVVKATSTTTSSSLATTTSSSSKSSGSSKSSNKTSGSSKNTSKAAAKNSTKGTSGIKSTTTQKAGNYLASSAKQVVLGNYTDDVTLLGTAGQVAAGLLNADLPGDIRDLTYDVTNWEWSWSHAGQTTVDAIGLIPVIGAVKYVDEVGVLLKNGDEAAAALKGGLDDVSTAAKKHINRNVKDIDAYDDIQKHLGNGVETNIHPNRGTIEPDSIYVKQPDGTYKGVRIGNHEVKNPNNQHYHLESFDADGNFIGPDQSVKINTTRKK